VSQQQLHESCLKSYYEENQIGIRKCDIRNVQCLVNEIAIGFRDRLKINLIITDCNDNLTCIIIPLNRMQLTKVALRISNGQEEHVILRTRHCRATFEVFTITVAMVDCKKKNKRPGKVAQRVQLNKVDLNGEALFLNLFAVREPIASVVIIVRHTHSAKVRRTLFARLNLRL
jgi:hypothetical protein